MALIKCGECGKEISNKAKTCVNCGAPIDYESNLPRKKVIIKKCFHSALRTSVFIDNQPIGEIGIGANTTIEIELPIGIHYVGLSTSVKYGNFLSPVAASNASDGKQFVIDENDDIIEIEILAKGSFSNSTGRCIVGKIIKCDENTINIENMEYTKRINFLRKHYVSFVCLTEIATILFSFIIMSIVNGNFNVDNLETAIYLSIFITPIIIWIIFMLTLRKKKH